jgi:hypothetical protein
LREDTPVLLAYVLINSTEEISSLKVNLPGGPSYKIFNDDTGPYSWCTNVAFYRRPTRLAS